MIFRGEYGISGIPNQKLGIAETLQYATRACQHGIRRPLGRSECAGFKYYYAHLDGYVKGLHEGMQVERGDVIGFVGSTGNANPQTPHLHFAIFELGPERRWWQGTAVNPYPGLAAAVKRAR